MPVIHDIPLSPKAREVLRRQGLGRRAKAKPEIEISIWELITSVKTARLLEPAVAYEYYAVSGMNGSQISLEGDKAIHAPLIPAIFPQAKELVVLICTIDPKLEKQVTAYSRSDEALRGMILDGIVSAVVDSLVPKVLRLIASEVSSRGYEISSPVNPGMPSFPLSEQWNLLGLVNADEIGVSLTSSGIMVPRKSVSMVIGIGAQIIWWTQSEVCARCRLRETCHYKVTKWEGNDCFHH
jgi:hypothetical protein